MEILLCSLIGYFIGSVNPAYILSKLRGFDIRNRGSGNAGASNTVIIMGKKAGFLVAVFDICKAIIAAEIGAYLFSQFKFSKILAGSSCIIGHIYPIFMKFHGGKGLACLGGLILSFNPRLFSLLLLAEIVLAFSIDYICVVPITGSLIFTSCYAFLTGDAVGTLILSIVTLVIVYKHIENIYRIRNGTEAHISFLWKKEQELERIRKNEHT
ncbi:MAG: glycerol-3-phosphate acyltransferase [Ruminococcus sp.]|nr:glycerol-3-phosphate acyltransferase [Ruminococcus sp.]